MSRIARIVFLSVLVLVLTSVLFVRAYLNATFAPDGGTVRSIDRGNAAPEEILDGGPIIDASTATPRSYRLPPKTIALTFDDGPSAEWTPAILDVLRSHRVPATFFVLGERILDYPEIVKRTLAEGHEIGSHTFTHPDLTQLPTWRRDLEYSQTQGALAAVTGMTTALLRQPYSSSPSAVDKLMWQGIQHAAGEGYLTVLSDTDSRDWEPNRSIDEMIRTATPAGDEGSVVLWHDAGGDRARTVTALRRFIPLMLAKGYRFTTVTDGLKAAVDPTGSSTAAGNKLFEGNVRADGDTIWRGRALDWIVWITNQSFSLLWVLFLVVGVLTIGRTLLMFYFAIRHTRQRRDPAFSWGPPITEPVSVVVPAYNEKEGIAAAVQSLAGGDYPTIDVVVIDDGSTDNTADIAADLGLPNVRVVTVPNGGKPTALNIGTAYARHDIIVMVDGDTIFEPQALRRLVQPFADPKVGAVSGNVKVGNRDSMVARWQHIEYVIGFNLDRRMYDLLRCMPTVPGAIGAFRRAALRDVGGVSHETLAEDTDLTMAMCRAGWRVVYEEDARAWTEAPSSLGQLWKQRYRWSYGTMQAMWKHRGAVRDGSAFGLLGLPLIALFGVTLPLLAPLFDLLAIYGALVLDTKTTVIAWVAMLGLQFLIAIVAFWLDKESLKPLWVLPLQQFVYRQTMYLVIIQSVITAFTGARLRWHKLRRVGLNPGDPALLTSAPLAGPPAVRSGQPAPVSSAATTYGSGGTYGTSSGSGGGSTYGSSRQESVRYGSSSGGGGTYGSDGQGSSSTYSSPPAPQQRSPQRMSGYPPQDS